jgi:hypothetical protein
MRTRQSTAAVAVGVAALLAYSWVASGVRTFTGGAEIVVGIPILLAFGIGVSWRRTTHLTDDGPTRPAIWIALVLTLVAWELFELFSKPRHDHPTISSIGDRILDPRPVRAAAFAAWLVLGWLLARRRRA